MNKTQNYKLNQWEKSDRVLMEDFNADNAKIDAAVKALADSKADRSALTALQNTVSAVSARAGSEFIINYTLAETTGTVDIDISGVDWSKYSIVLSYIEPANAVSYFNPFSNETMSGVTVSVLFPMRSGDTRVIGFNVFSTSEFRLISKDKAFRELDTYYLKRWQNDFQPGLKIRVIGIH